MHDWKKIYIEAFLINLKLFDFFLFCYKWIHFMSMYKSALYLRQDLLTMYVEYIAWVIIHWWKLISGIFSQIYILYKNLDVSWNCIFACIIFFQLKFLFLLMNFNSYIAHIIFKFFSLFLLLFTFFVPFLNIYLNWLIIITF